MKKSLVLLLFSFFTISAFPVEEINNNITSKLKDLISNAKKELSDLSDFMSSLEEEISKIDKGEIAYVNDEIKEFKNKIIAIRDRRNAIINECESLEKGNIECRLSKNPTPQELIDRRELNEAIDEWNSFIDNENNPKVKTCIEKINNFISKANKLPSVPLELSVKKEIKRPMKVAK